jgi:hypothetical protein
VEAVRLEIVRESARASDPRHEHRLLRLELLGDEKLFDSGENRVISAARAPPGHGSFVIVEHELAIVVVEERQDGAV